MNPISETNHNTWTPQIWQGNPSLNLICSCKIFKYKSRNIPVWIFGGTETLKEFSFTVNAGSDSDYSYSGRCTSTTLSQAEIEVDNKYKNNTLIK